jgi:hypothetical protein
MTWARSIADQLDPSGIDVLKLLGAQPHAKQMAFLRAQEDEVLGGGSRGGGKTWTLVVLALCLGIWYPGIRILLCRRSYPELKATVVAELARLGFGKKLGCVWSQQEMSLRFPNGSLCQLTYIDSISDLARFQGTEWQAILLDEAGLLIAEALPTLRETLRGGAPGMPHIIRLTANPGGPSHGYLKSHFVDATDHGQRVVTGVDGRSTRFQPFSVYDNTANVGDAYVRLLEGIEDPARRAAMLEGDWSAFAGQVFQEWSRARHVVPRITLPASWRRWCGIDYGFAAPFAAVWLAIDVDGRAWCYREMYQRGLGPDEQARWILSVEREAGEQETVHWIDPSTAAKLTATAPSIQEMYAMEGLGTQAADNDRLAGWQSVHSYLAEGPICQVHAAQRDRDEWRGDTCPKLHVLEGCAPNLVRTLPDLPYDPVRVEDVDTRADDHISDALRYVLHSLGAGGRPVFHGAFASDAQPQRPPSERAEFRQAMAQATAGDWVETERPDDRPAWSKQPATSGVGATQRSPFARAQEDNDESD